MSLPLRARCSLSAVARSPTFRIDAKQAAPSSVQLDAILDRVPTFYLNEFLPEPFVKGRQPIYLDDTQDEGLWSSTLVPCVRSVSPSGFVAGSRPPTLRASLLRVNFETAMSCSPRTGHLHRQGRGLQDTLR